MSISLHTRFLILAGPVIIIATLVVGLFPGKILAATNHVVISEIQIAGQTSTDEFVELYNPTSQEVNLNGWRLSRKTASGQTIDNLLTTVSGIIPAHGFFLITHQNYNGTTPADAEYSTASSIADDNTIILYSDSGQTEVDKVGLGTASDKETLTIGNPDANSSVERKAHVTSTYQSMKINGFDANFGNGEDTDDNSIDFISRSISHPQNSSSPVEYPSTSEPKILFFRHQVQTILQEVKERVDKEGN